MMFATNRSMLPLPLAALASASILACAPAAEGGGFDPAEIRAYLQDGIEQSKAMDLRFAEAIPDSALAWAPTADVRTFAQQIAHAANNYWLSSGFGVEAPSFDEAGVGASREALADGVAAAYDWLAARLAEIPDEELGATVDFFGGPTTKWRMFTQALEHAYWTRGQTVPYFHAHGVDVPQVTFF